MKLNFKFDSTVAFKKILQEQLDKLGLEYNAYGISEVEIVKSISPDEQTQLIAALNQYGISILENQKEAFVQKIKDTLIEMIFFDAKLPSEKISIYLEEKLNHRYGYIANHFSEITHTSIEYYIILQKIERAKRMIIEEGLTLTEVAYQLNYSSVAHLSTQFKKITGLTPTVFQRIINKRQEILQLDKQSKPI